MRLLLDTHILIGLAKGTLPRRAPAIAARLAAQDVASYVSAVSLWEVAIKTRVGKLDMAMSLDDLSAFVETVGLRRLAVDHRHAIAPVEPEPATRDPFDRMLLAQCAVEDLRLVTFDRALSDHALAWKPA